VSIYLIKTLTKIKIFDQFSIYFMLYTHIRTFILFFLILNDFTYSEKRVIYVFHLIINLSSLKRQPIFLHIFLFFYYISEFKYSGMIMGFCNRNDPTDCSERIKIKT